MAKKRTLEDIEQSGKVLANMCIDFANEGELTQVSNRLIRLFGSFVVAVGALTEVIQSSSAEFMAEIEQGPEDVRGANL